MAWVAVHKNGEEGIFTNKPMRVSVSGYWYDDFENVAPPELIPKGAVIAKKQIDWEQVRIDAAIAALNGFCSNYHMARLSDVSLSISSVGAADALIAELKKGGKDETK